MSLCGCKLTLSMSKKKKRLAAKSAKKQIRKELDIKILQELEQAITTLGHDPKEVKKELKRASDKLSKKLAKKVNKNLSNIITTEVAAEDKAETVAESKA